MDGCVWYKPPAYIWIHVFTGIASSWIPLMLFAVVGYHLGQYLVNVRIFALEFEISEGNSVLHTLIKLSEVALGSAIGYTLKNLPNLSE
jgi:hypothetical protein